MWESDVESKFVEKKTKSNFLTVALLPSLLMSLESKNLLEDSFTSGVSTRGPPAALERVSCGPGRLFHKMQCVMNIEA